MPDYWSPYTGGAYSPELEVDTGLDSATIQSIAGEARQPAPTRFHIHPKIKSSSSSAPRWARVDSPSITAWPKPLPSARSCCAARRSASAARTPSAAPSTSATPSSSTSKTSSAGSPLNHLDPKQAHFSVYNSILSEAGVLGFEYGYSRDYPEALVLWEAQFGDFANGAQIIIDQFIAAGEDKWGLLSGVTLLLPHGYEGQGPEHSSARIERYLQLAARDNIQVCQPSNAAQYFHLLRRQALRKWRKPLIVFTPKSMLRHPDALSPIADLSRPRFLPVVPETQIENASRILIATGKIGHELRVERAKRKDRTAAILFLDQLYPWPEAELKAAIAAHPTAREIVWVQEEPANMGAFNFVAPRLRRIAGSRQVLSVKRSAAASPATGSAKAHEMEQKTLIDLALKANN